MSTKVTLNLVMEFAKGQTLALLLDKGPLDCARGLRLGIQMASALRAAHAAGVVHRDLKPGNIMVHADSIQILDFGLAQMANPDPAGDATVTVTGVRMGTPTWMAPEQAEGKHCDERTDIFALGLVLYFMLTGRKAFDAHGRDSEADGDLPATVRHIVRRCIAYDPESRWQAASDVEFELRWAADQLANPATQPPAATPRNPVWLAVAVATALVVTLASGWLWHSRNASDLNRQVYRTSVLWPPDAAPNLLSSDRFALSPDGKYVAIAAGGRLWVRPLDRVDAQPIPGTEDGSGFFWSPDSRSLGFSAHGKLQRVDLGGGPPVTLADRGAGVGGGSWSTGNVIVFPANHVLQQVSASGGPSLPVTAFHQENGDRNHEFPFFLPDGNHFLYAATGSRSGSPYQIRAILLGSLQSKEPKLILEGGSNAEYAQGRLFFVRHGALLAQDFDPDRGELKGEPSLIAPEIQTDSVMDAQRAAFSVSPAGALAYLPGNSEQLRRLVWLDRTGKQSKAFEEQARYSAPELSPDGSHAAFSIPDPATETRDIWIFDLARGVSTRLTQGEREVRAIAWSPDGSKIVFRAAREGRLDLFQKDVNGSGASRLLLKDAVSKYPTSWSSDGRYILYHTGGGTPRTGADIWALPLFGDQKPFPLLQTAFAEANARFSPDARWIAYESNESGRMEIYCTAFPGAGARWRISSNGGTRARWRSDGREILYLAPDNFIVSVPVTARGSAIDPGQPQPLLRMPPDGRAWDASADGRNFLVSTSPRVSSETPITLMLNWTAALQTKH